MCLVALAAVRRRRRRRRSVELCSGEIGWWVWVSVSFPPCVRSSALIGFFFGMDGLVSVLYLLSQSVDYSLFLSPYPFCSSLIFDNTDHIHHPVSLRLYLLFFTYSLVVVIPSFFCTLYISKDTSRNHCENVNSE